jgi:hypothetical protein
LDRGQSALANGQGVETPRESVDLGLAGTVRSRLAARFYTGPVGHLVAGVADWAELLVRWKWARFAARFNRARASR